ncbi:MAG: 2-C-methyl-D-erythritol 4-phosphate cytidylyltransferase [Deltaproteobacteria bacterium]|nr:MAG: 2-C-methyl-D-erythritol 4-phosphate cytidylyltransferase [Deltaproteobacteria bacterium]
MTVAALVLAAGRGERLGDSVPKAYLPLAGTPLVVRALEAMAASPDVDRVTPVVAEADLERFAALAPALRRVPKLTDPVLGGAERQDSVKCGLAALGEAVGWVAVHDAARPLVEPDAVSRVVRAAREHGAALLALPVADTIKRVADGVVVETPPREAFWAAQTPQVFRAELLREAIAKAEAEGLRATDDAALVERLGVRVRVVRGDPSNLKITHREDLAAAEAWLRARAGAGTDA